MTTDLTPKDMVVGGRYNWKHQPERLIYLGVNIDPTGTWHQFCKVSDLRRKVWCEVRGADLESFEVTKQEGGIVILTDHNAGSTCDDLRAARKKMEMDLIVIDDHLIFSRPARKKAQWKSEVYERKR